MSYLFIEKLTGFIFRFAFDGLPGLIVHILISEATYIKRLNNNGVQKMGRNILALQQNLSNFVPLSQCSIMEKARQYYQMFNLSSEVRHSVCLIVRFYLRLDILGYHQIYSRKWTQVYF